MANYLTILQRLDEWGHPSDDETVEAFLEHSKTKHSRYVNAVGLSKGPARVRLADFLRAYWKAAGMKVVSRLEAGYMSQDLTTPFCACPWSHSLDHRKGIWRGLRCWGAF